jgi:hypothetical protein
MFNVDTSAERQTRFKSWLGANRAPVAIGTGLAIQFLATWWAEAPVVTGMALVALGATISVIGRFERAATRPLFAAANLFVYLNLYLLFVAAVTHAAMNGPQDGLTFWQGLDFGASVLPMAAVIRVSFKTLAAGGDARTP